MSRTAERLQTMDPAGERAMAKLFTCYVTIVYVDPDSGEVRHAPVETNPPANLVLAGGEGDTHLEYIGGSSADCRIVCISEGGALGLAAEGSGGASVFSRVPARRGDFRLAARGLFLGAPPDGRITLAAHERPKCERFRVRDGVVETAGTVFTQRLDGQLIHFFIADRKDVIQRALLRGEFYERELLERIRAHARSDRLYVDIGANVGNHAVFASKYCNFAGIVAFEANPAAVRLLQINLALNACANVDASSLGLALAAGPARLRPGPSEPHDLGRTRLIADPHGGIAAIAGDERLLSRPVGVIKIDVEGMEFDVLEGLAETIKRWRPTLFVEVWAQAREALTAWCARAGYEIAEELPTDNYLLLPREAGTGSAP